MCKDAKTAKIKQIELERNNKIAKKRYIVEQHFVLSDLNEGAYLSRFTTIVKNISDAMRRQICPVK